MSFPASKYIDKIDYTTLKFLVNDSVVNSITSTNFYLDTGKPKQNLNLNPKIDSFFINTIKENFYENININNDLIYKYPKLLELDTLRDMQVSNETTIDAIFVYEGASMKNMFGYYMYTIDVDGNKKILANDPDVNNPDGYYYDPTVVFPYVYSNENDSTSLQKGNTRRMKGNLPNGNFENIYIGLFLIPHGWYAFEQNSPIDNNAIFYSTIDFNKLYNNTEYITEKDKIYSIYFKAQSENGNELLLVGFEDIFVNGIYDLDYNDCVVGFEISNVNNIVDYDKYTSVEVETDDSQHNNIIYIDENGEYVKLNKDVYNIDTNTTYKFERHMLFSNQQDRDDFYDIYTLSNANYKFSVNKVFEYEKNCLVIVYLFRQNDIKLIFGDSPGNSNKILYIYESKYNKNNNTDITNLNNYKKMIIKMLNDTSYSEKYKLYKTSDNSEVIHLTDTIDKPQLYDNIKFRIIGNGVMDCKNGKSKLPSNNKQIYKVYKNVNSNNTIDINIKMDNHPTNYMLNQKTFVRYVSFKGNDNELIVIDLANLNLYTESSGVLTLNNSITFDNIEISNIIYTNGNIKDLISIFKTDSDAYYRTVKINNLMTFYCIRLPNVKNNPTMVFLNDSLYIQWNDLSNTISGTFYNKQTLYPTSTFSS